MSPDTLVDVESLTVTYRGLPALCGVDLEIRRHGVTAFIGPSGCGKSTLLRCFNRMNDLIDAAEVSGRVRFEGQDIYGPDVDPSELRRRVGMVFQKSNPFPMSIFDNVAFGPKIAGVRSKRCLEDIVESSLEQAALWDEVKDRLRDHALSLSGGQQQRLCIARALAVEPDLLLMDEPCSALDPVATSKIEDLIHNLKARYTIAIVTHNMQQAARVSDVTAFFLEGELVEMGATADVFERPRDARTEAYISGRFG